MSINNSLTRIQAHYQAIVEHLGEGLFVLQDNRIVFANPLASQIMGVPYELLMGSDPVQWIHPEDLKTVLDLRTRLSQKLPVAERYEFRHVGIDGRTRWLNIRPKKVAWDTGVATLTFLSDVSERKKVEEETLRTSSEREAILNSALVGIVLSIDRKHQWVNDKFAEMLGYSREELIGQSSVDIHLDRASWEALGAQQRAGLLAHGTYSNERQLRRKNGEVFWVQMDGRCIQANNPDSGVIWTFLDITERILAEHNTRAALEKQKELNALRSRFVAMTSHEFRTPLATILSSSELLQHYGHRMPDSEKAEILQTIESGVHRMARMLDRILLLGKVDAQMLEFRPVDLDVLALCNDLVDDARAQFPSTPCELVTAFDPALQHGIYDERLLRHIFGNLLSNALKYSPDGGVVTFNIAQESGATLFKVTDQGIGIPADEIPHLFESFHRASNVGSIAGTGLGLAIVKNSVALHGGNVAVSSETGVGTTFEVRLPCAR